MSIELEMKKLEESGVGTPDFYKHLYDIMMNHEPIEDIKVIQKKYPVEVLKTASMIVSDTKKSSAELMDMLQNLKSNN